MPTSPTSLLRDMRAVSGSGPKPARDYEFLFDYGDPGWKSILNRDLGMARDCYDDCIAFLDEQLGQLMDNLNGQGLLENTVVIITSDHGESFGDHGLYLHGTSLYLDEIGVPLVILSPDAPANRVVNEPVSLRDLPATVVDSLVFRLAHRSRGDRSRPTGPRHPE